MPDGAGALKACELASGLRIGLDRRIIGGRKFEISDKAVADGPTCTISQADRNHRAAHAIGNQDGLFTNQLCMERAVCIVDSALECLDQVTVGAAHFCGEDGIPFFQFERAPQADGKRFDAVLASALKGKFIDRLAIGEQFDGLVRQMLDRNTDRFCARIVIGLGKQPADFRHLAGKPVTTAPGSIGIGRRRRAVDRLAFEARSIFACDAAKIRADQ